MIIKKRNQSELIVEVKDIVQAKGSVFFFFLCLHFAHYTHPHMYVCHEQENQVSSY